MRKGDVKHIFGGEEFVNNERLINIVLRYREELRGKIVERKQEMLEDQNDHYLMYNVLGVTSEEGYEIDYQQNVGRFLYKYAGSLSEDLVIECLKEKYPQAKAKVKIANAVDKSPKEFEIDCLVDKIAYEIKWKDGTTDGDHVKKENKRVKSIKAAGYVPVRIMLFEPNRNQAIKIQAKLEKLYESVGGEYYSGQKAWEYLKKKTGVDLKKILKNLGE